MTGTARLGGTALKGLAALTFLILTASACGPSAEPPPPPPPPQAVPNVGAVMTDLGMPGRPDSNPSSTNVYLSSLNWLDNLPPDQMVDEVVNWPGGSARIRIVPSSSTNGVPWQTAVGTGNGYFVAKIYNVERKQLGPFGLGPSDDVGYLWVGEIGPNRRGVRIYTVKPGAVTPKGNILTFKGYCPDGHPVPAVQIKPPDCPAPSPAAPQAGASTDPRFILASVTSAAAQGSRGLWIACSGGCCEVGGAEVD